MVVRDGGGRREKRRKVVKRHRRVVMRQMRGRDAMYSEVTPVNAAV